MIRALIEGVILGITLAFLVGPAFISLIQTSIYRGFVSGMQFAFGIILSDFVLIALIYLGALKVLSNFKHQILVGIIGGFILILFGIYTYRRKAKISKSSTINLPLRPANIFKYVFKGFFINILNPFLIIFWLSVVSLVSAKYGVRSPELSIFFAGTLGGVFLTDTVKCLIANRIRDFLNFKVLTWMNRVVGFMLVTFGVVLIVRVIIMFV